MPAVRGAVTVAPMNVMTRAMDPGPTEPAPRPRRMLPPRVRRAVLTLHIIVSVGLLGDVAGFLAVAIRASTAEPGRAAVLNDVLSMFGMLFGIPLSAIALITGVTLGLGSRWGVFRSRWVTVKLLLLLSIMLVGTFVIGPAEVAVRAGDAGAASRLVAAGVWDLLALVVATVLSVYKPALRRRRTPRRPVGAAP
jgi:hypothetical protein